MFMSRSLFIFVLPWIFSIITAIDFSTSWEVFLKIWKRLWLYCKLLAFRYWSLQTLCLFHRHRWGGPCIVQGVVQMGMLLCFLAIFWIHLTYLWWILWMISVMLMFLIVFLFLGNIFFEDWLILNLRGLLCLEVVHRRISLGYQPLEVISGVWLYMLFYVPGEDGLNFVCLSIVQYLLADQVVAILCLEGLLVFCRKGCCCQLECRCILCCWTSFFL